MTTQLPIVNYKGKRWFMDNRLNELRNILNPHDYIDMDSIDVSLITSGPIEKKDNKTKRWCVNCNYASNFQSGPTPSGKFDGCDCSNLKAIARIYPDEKPDIELGKDIFRGEAIDGDLFNCPQFEKATKKQLKERKEVFEYDKKQLNL